MSSNYDSQKAAGCPQSARAYSDSRARGRGVLVDLTREHAAGGRRGLAPVVAVAPFMSSSLHPPSDHDRYVVPVRYSLSAPPCAQLWRHASPRTTGTPRCLLPTLGANCQWQRGRVPVAGLPVPAVLRDSVCCYKLPPHSRFDRLPAATGWRGNPVCASAPLQVKPRPAFRRRARVVHQTCGLRAEACRGSWASVLQLSPDGQCSLDPQCVGLFQGVPSGVLN